MAEEDDSADGYELVAILDDLLTNEKFDEALSIFGDINRRALVVERGLDLLPVVCRHLTREVCDTNPELQDCCEEIVDRLAQTGNPKELLVGLLEQAEACDDDIKFQLLLKPIKTVLLRLPAKRGKSLEWVMSVVFAYVRKMPVPSTYNFEGKERMLIDLDPNAQRLNSVFLSLILFFEPFVNEICFGCDSLPNNVRHQRNTLTRFLLQYFDHPLAFMDLSQRRMEEAKTGSRSAADRFVFYIRKLQGDFYKLFDVCAENMPKKSPKGNPALLEDVELDEAMVNIVSPLSLATFFYLVLAEGVELDHLPSVYAHLYVIEKCLPLVNTLLKRSEDCAVHKGILFADVLWRKVQVGQLGYELLDFTEYLSLSQNLIDLMVCNSVQEHRRAAVKMLPVYINKFEYRGRYRLLECLLTSNSHAGVQGLLISCFKTNLVETLGLSPVPSFFTRNNLTSVLHVVVPLPDGVETDLLDQSDRILGVLNLIRFLTLRDCPQENVTGIWDNVALIEEKLLTPLQKALDISRAHYQLELKHQQEDGNTGTTCSGHLNVVVGDQPFPNMPLKQRLDVLHSALNVFDIIESVTTRITELLETGKTRTVA